MAKAPSILKKEDNGLTSDPRWELTLRVASSSYFQKSTKLRDFLLYICDRTITGNLDEVREQQIGSKVFNRRLDYNPSEDNIVRVEARELRKRLESFFEREGAAEPSVITIPKGAYVPSFDAREFPLPEAEQSAAVATGATEKVAKALPKSSTVFESARIITSKWSIKTYTLLALFLALLTACIWLWNSNRQMEQMLQANHSNILTEDSIWRELFDFNRQTDIVLSDTCLVVFLLMTNQQVSLEDYISRKYLSQMNTPELRLISDRQYTDLADVNISSKIIQLAIAYRDHVAIRYARNAQTQDFKSHNIILLGSRDSNPWADLFEKLQNFSFEYNKTPPRPINKSHIRNKSPQGKEEPYYLTGGKDGTTDDAYAVIAFLPNLSQDGKVLIIEGTNAEATEGAGELIAKPDFSNKLRIFLKMDPKQRSWPYFELLLRTNTLGGTTKEITYITHRFIPREKLQAILPEKN